MADTPVIFPQSYDYPHLRIDRFRQRSDYRPRGLRITVKEPGLDRFSHGNKLNGQLAQALVNAHGMLQQRSNDIAAGDAGVYVEIASLPEKPLPDSAWQQKGIRLAAVRTEEDHSQVGGLFVPLSAEGFLQNALSDYTAGEGAKSFKARIDKIDRIAPATAATLWFDRRPLPDAGHPIWWECWCWKDRDSHLAGPAEKLGLRVSDQRLVFPDCVVIPVYGTRADIEKLLIHTE